MPGKPEADQSGNVKLKPIIGWEIGPVAGISLLLAIQYAESPQEFQTGGKSVRFVLTPEQALLLAEKLQKAGKSLLQPTPQGMPYQ
jgi:hypothetical protein